jgi:hypothetical protein
MKNKQKKSKKPANNEVQPRNEHVTILDLTDNQRTAWWWAQFGPGGPWANVVTDKYGPWRAAEPGEGGIPCTIEVMVFAH